MEVDACEFRQYIIRPTLAYLGRQSAVAEALLLGIAASQSGFGLALDDRRGHGLYRIAGARHQALWDHYLAQDPELASRIRGLASQHAFLAAPHLELTVNLRYATAIAWMLVEADHSELPEAGDLPALARIWRRVFQPEAREQTFLHAWKRCITATGGVAADPLPVE